MATSSITKNFVISGKEQVEMFINAIEESAQNRPVRTPVAFEFSCPKNPDVEHFLKKNAIEFTRKSQSVTYLVFSLSSMELAGYFIIVMKPLTVRGETV